MAPHDRRGSPTPGPHRPGKGIDKRVARCVVALAGRAEHATERGEQHERGQLQLFGQLGQVARGLDLHPQHVVDLLDRQVGEQRVIQRGRGVHHGGQRLLGGNPGQQLGERVPVREIHSGHRDRGARLGQLSDQLLSARRGHAPTTGQQQVFGTVPGQPTGNVRTQRASATGDQHRPPGPPTRTGQRRDVRVGVGEPARVNSVGANHELVLGVRSGQQSGQPGQGGPVQCARQIHQTTPALRVLLADHGTKSPHQRLNRLGHRVSRSCGHSPPRHHPQWRVDRGVTQCLHQCNRAGIPGRNGRVGGMAARGKSQQGEHPGRRGNVGHRCRQPGRDARPIRGGVQLDRHDPGALIGHRLADRLRPLDPLASRSHHQPGANQFGGCRLRQFLPGDPIAPSIHSGCFPLASTPRGEHRQHRFQRIALLIVGLERVAQRGQVLLLDRSPEPVVALGPRGRGGLAPHRLARPEPLVLEGIRRQPDQPSLATGLVR